MSIMGQSSGERRPVVEGIAGPAFAQPQRKTLLPHRIVNGSLLQRLLEYILSSPELERLRFFIGEVDVLRDGFQRLGHGGKLYYLSMTKQLKNCCSNEERKETYHTIFIIVSCTCKKFIELCIERARLYFHV